MTPPKDIWNVTGAKVFLSCEVIGIPTPVLIWNKVSSAGLGKASCKPEIVFCMAQGGGNGTAQSASTAGCPTTMKPVAAGITLHWHGSFLTSISPVLLWVAVSKQGAWETQRTVVNI